MLAISVSRRSNFDASAIKELVAANWNELAKSPVPVLVWCYENRFDAYTVSESWIARHQIFERIAAANQGRVTILKVATEQDAVRSELGIQRDPVDSYSDNILLVNNGKVLERLKLVHPSVENVQFFLDQTLARASVKH